jgi:hypothetical protein
MDITSMTTTTQTVWLTLKSDVPNNLPQSFTLADGGKVVYYPNGVIDNSKGIKKMNSSSYLVVSPFGQPLEVTNLSDFCTTLFGTTDGTNRPKFASSFRDLVTGIRKETDVKGWTKFESNSKVELTVVPSLDNDTEAMELMAS